MLGLPRAHLCDFWNLFASDVHMAFQDKTEAFASWSVVRPSHFSRWLNVAVPYKSCTNPHLEQIKVYITVKNYQQQQPLKKNSCWESVVTFWTVSNAKVAFSVWTHKTEAKSEVSKPKTKAACRGAESEATLWFLADHLLFLSPILSPDRSSFEALSWVITFSASMLLVGLQEGRF